MQSSLNFPISFNGTCLGIGESTGYGYAAVQLIKAWQRKMHPVSWWQEDAPIAFSFSQPEGYEWQNEKQVRIGYTPWESTKLPDGWVERMNKMHEIWAPCHANIDWYKKNGVKVPLRVLPHGINSEHFPLVKRKKAQDEPFKFLHIGEPAERKGGEIAYRCFVEEFGDNDEVTLTLKGNPRFKVEAPNVRVIREHLTQDQLRSLYLNHHAFIYPGYGEGFGFLPFQAAATGMPTLVTNWSGPRDYIKYCWPIKVERMMKAHYYPHEGLWAKPDEENFRLWMRYFFESPDYFFSHAFLRVSTMHKQWSWDSVADTSLGWFKELLKNKLMI